MISTRKNILAYSRGNGKFKRLDSHFQISATRTGSKVTETAVALPHSRSAPRSPNLPCQIMDKKFGARAELRNILQEKLRGTGGSSRRFESLQKKMLGQRDTGGWVVGQMTNNKHVPLNLRVAAPTYVPGTIKEYLLFVVCIVRSIVLGTCRYRTW